MVKDRYALQLLVAFALLLAASLAVAWQFGPDRSPRPCEVAVNPAMLPEIPEASGLAVSRRNPGLLWSHNDSGNAAVLFAFDATGAIRGRVRVPIRTRDWEDVSAGRCPDGDCLYIADIGDNRLVRPSVRIYRVPEPRAGDADTAAPAVFTVTYEDGPHNAEAMFVVGSDLFIVTRDRVGAVYRAKAGKSGDLTFRRVTALGLAAVTDAEASHDETVVVVRTSREAVFYRTAELTAGHNVPFFRVPIDWLHEAQGEGVALDGNMLYLSSEGWRLNRAGRFLGLRCKLPQ